MKKLDMHAEQLGALGNSVRLAAIRLVVQAGAEGLPVGDIQAKLDVPASTLSHHLERLARSRLVETRRDGKFVFYSAAFPALRALTDYLWEDCCKGGRNAECCG